MKVTVTTSKRSPSMTLSVKEFVPKENSILFVRKLKNDNNRNQTENHYGLPIAIILSEKELREKC